MEPSIRPLSNYECGVEFITRRFPQSTFLPLVRIPIGEDAAADIRLLVRFFGFRFLSLVSNRDVQQS